MTAPIAVDPSALAATGTTVNSEGDAAAAATQTLSSALSGAGALFGHDSAGIVFGQGYTQSGQALLDAAESAVNACRRVGFGVQMSASNYGKANAASTVGGGESPVPAPTEPPCFGGLTMPPPMGGGVAAPLGWTLVEQFVGDVWPDGNPAQMHAAAAAWRAFGAAMGAAAGPVSATGTALGGQQIPESGKMVEAVGNIGSGLSDIAAQAQALASKVDEFAANVQATQEAVRDLLRQLSPGGVLETIGGIFTGHNPMDKVKQVANEIKTVLNNMKREADASNQLFSQGINALDSATDSLEGWAKKEFVSVFGQDVGNALSSHFNAMVDLPEGGLKFVAQTAHGLEQLDPTRFAYDPQGATNTWKGLEKSAEAITNPVHLVGEIMDDPQGSLNTVKGMVDWEDVEKGHPFRALGYNFAQLGTLAIPGAGEASPAVDAASAEARVAATSAGAESRAAGAATRDAGAAAATRAAGATEGITSKAGEIGSKLDGVRVPEGATPGSSVPGGRAPVEPPVPPETPRVEPTPRAPEAPRSEPPVAAEPHTPAEPHVSAPHGGDAPVAPEAPRPPEPVPHSAEMPTAPAAEPHAPAATAPRMDAPAAPSAAGIPSASDALGAAQPIEHAAAPSQELASVGAESRGAESAVNAGDHAPGGVEHGGGSGESGPGGPSDGHAAPSEGTHGPSSDSSDSSGHTPRDGETHTPDDGGHSGDSGDHHGGHGAGDEGTGHDTRPPEQHSAGRDIFASSDPAGEHWERIADGPDDPHYGEPVEHPGPSDPLHPITGKNSETWDLFRNPDELYGHDSAGNPLTKDGYDSRYRELQTSGAIYDNYPPNAGAVPGTRVQFDDAHAFIRHFGEDVDRIGEPTGKYLGLVENGIPASFEERSLPIGSLNEAYYQYRLTGELPTGWHIEVSEIAPGLGRDGGGIQLQITNSNGRVMTIDDLIDAGVLE